MAIFPEYLYALTARDQQVTPIEVVLSQLAGTLSFASTNVQLNGGYTVPAGKILIITSVTFQARPGAAQQVIAGRLFATKIGNQQFNLVSGVPDAFATNIDTYFPGMAPGPVYVPEGFVINAELWFSAGAAANLAGCMLTGILIPRGNFAI